MPIARTRALFPILMVLPLMTTPLSAQSADDPFQWLEDVEAPKALSWVEQQNTLTRETLRGRPQYQRLYDEIGMNTGTLELIQDKALRYALTDAQALAALRWLARHEGILCALESAHAVALAMDLRFDPSDVVVINVSGRGDKDLEHLEAAS